MEKNTTVNKLNNHYVYYNHM